GCFAGVLFFEKPFHVLLFVSKSRSSCGEGVSWGSWIRCWSSCSGWGGRGCSGKGVMLMLNFNPTCFQVTLMLLDQNNREHIIDAFRPDISSSSFQRPVSDMNIASGCPLFCPLSKLDSKNSYIRDDTIFIKAIVDLTGL
uniref:TRAF1-6 MATH domain-containing protein n=1 Tax=Cynoglossus semilaevis TaxID=244447 RepID=A0A3P8WD55_CYNSE